MTVYNINLNRFAWVAQCVGDDECRYYLQGVRIEPREAGGVWMVATDGSVMAVAKDEQGVCPEPGTFRLDKTLADFCGPHTVYDDFGEPMKQWPLTDGVRLSFGLCDKDSHSLGTVAGSETGLVWRIGEMPTGYVDWRSALAASGEKRSPVSGDVGSLSPELLSRLSYQGRGVSVMHRSGCKAIGGRQSIPSALVLSEDAPWAFGAIMPRAGDLWKEAGETLREVLDEADWPQNGNSFEARS